MNAYQAAEKLQTAYNYGVANRDSYFSVSHILGSDWACGMWRGGTPEQYLNLVREMAEAQFGELPFDPFSI